MPCCLMTSAKDCITNKSERKEGNCMVDRIRERERERKKEIID